MGGRLVCPGRQRPQQPQPQPPQPPHPPHPQPPPRRLASPTDPSELTEICTRCGHAVAIPITAEATLCHPALRDGPRYEGAMGWRGLCEHLPVRIRAAGLLRHRRRRLAVPQRLENPPRPWHRRPGSPDQNMDQFLADCMLFKLEEHTQAQELEEAEGRFA